MNNSIPAHIHNIITDYIFGEIVVYLFQIAKFPCNAVLCQYIRHLNIKFLLPFVADEINLLCIQLSHLHIIPSAQHFQIHYIFK